MTTAHFPFQPVAPMKAADSAGQSHIIAVVAHGLGAVSQAWRFAQSCGRSTGSWNEGAAGRPVDQSAVDRAYEDAFGR